MTEIAEDNGKRVKGIDVFSVILMFIFTVICSPIGAAQYFLWYDGKPYSVAFMAMGLLFPFLFLAKIVEIARR